MDVRPRRRRRRCYNMLLAILEGHARWRDWKRLHFTWTARIRLVVIFPADVIAQRAIYSKNFFVYNLYLTRRLPVILRTQQQTNNDPSATSKKRYSGKKGKADHARKGVGGVLISLTLAVSP